jgi:hypothetical protein
MPALRESLPAARHGSAGRGWQARTAAEHITAYRCSGEVGSAGKGTQLEVLTVVLTAETAIRGLRKRQPLRLRQPRASPLQARCRFAAAEGMKMGPSGGILPVGD